LAFRLARYIAGTSSFFSPTATIFNEPSGNGRCNWSATGGGAVSQVSTSSG
jgi:hypothetical protein